MRGHSTSSERRRERDGRRGNGRLGELPLSAGLPVGRQLNRDGEKFPVPEHKRRCGGIHWDSAQLHRWATRLKFNLYP